MFYLGNFCVLFIFAGLIYFDVVVAALFSLSLSIYLSSTSLKEARLKALEVKILRSPHFFLKFHSVKANNNL